MNKMNLFITIVLAIFACAYADTQGKLAAVKDTTASAMLKQAGLPANINSVIGQTITIALPGRSEPPERYLYQVAGAHVQNGLVNFMVELFVPCGAKFRDSEVQHIVYVVTVHDTGGWFIEYRDSDGTRQEAVRIWFPDATRE